MPHDTSHDSTTLQPGRARGRGSERLVPALTLLSHPDPRRIGERSTLDELTREPVKLSRHVPEFSVPGSMWQHEPLADPFLSRRSWILEPMDDGGVVFNRAGTTMELLIDGERVEAERKVPRPALDDGVVVELGARVVLLLHLLPLSPPPRPAIGTELIGDSLELWRIRDAISRVASLEVPVLLRGETGTGKELVARALHAGSRRSEAPFVAVSLGALSPNLAASELFGNVKGAFTGAAHARAGLFRATDGGTLFLDEVGEAPSEIQALLLRALETRQILPVGSQKPVDVDLRLVAATDSNLEALAHRGDFRAPLLHRLATYEIWLPPLRHRRDDIGRLFLHFARQALAQMGRAATLKGLDPVAPPWIPSRLMARLARYSWPGNVRQLRNVVHQLVIDSQGLDQLDSGPRLEGLLSQPLDDGEPAIEARESDAARRRAPGDVSPAELEAALRACRFEPAAAARQLRISRASLYNLVRDHPSLRTAADLTQAEIREALDAADGVVRRAAERLEVSARALGRRIRRDPLG